MHELEVLKSLVPPPAAISEYDWAGTETALGFALPRDYKMLAETYGRGSFSDFLTVLVPLPAGGIVERGEYLRGYIGEILTTAATGPAQKPPVELDPKDPAVFGWGGTGNGDTCLWHTASSDPDEWTVLVTDTKGLWDHYAGGVVAYLAAALAGKAQSNVIDFAALAADGLYFAPAEGGGGAATAAG